MGKHELGIEVDEVSFEQDYHTYKQSDTFDVSALRYYRPTFYSFIADSASADLAQTRLKPSGSVSRIFVQVLRAILSSKLNELLLNEHP
jgi:hypothetical protein